MAGRGSFIESFPLFGYDLDDYEELFEEIRVKAIYATHKEALPIIITHQVSGVVIDEPVDPSEDQDAGVNLAEHHQIEQIETLLSKYASHLLEKKKTLTRLNCIARPIIIQRLPSYCLNWGRKPELHREI